MTEIVIPQEMLEHLKRANGDDFSATESPEGYVVKVNDPELERQLNIALKIIDEYEDTLRILAK